MMAFDPAAETARYIDSLGVDALARAAAYTSGSHWLLLWGLMVSFAVTWLLIRSRFLERLTTRLNITDKRPNLTAFAVSAAALLLLAILSLPWTLYSSYFRERSYGRTAQPLTDYLLQSGISTLLFAIIGGIVFTAIYALIRRTGRIWWLWGGGVVATAIAAILIISPIAIEPIFNDYQPIPAGEVRDALVKQAEAAGIPPERIFVFDGSRQSNNFTANVSGLFGSARIAISDVAFKGASLDEVVAVTGHEIGHYVSSHLWRIIALFVVLAMLFFFLADRLFPMAARLFGTRLNLADPAGVPILLFIVSTLGLLATPILNANTRSGEREADAYSLATTNLPDALSSALVKTAEYRYPRPHPVQEALFYSHPSVERRVRAAMEWKASHMPGPTPLPEPAG